MLSWGPDRYSASLYGCNVLYRFSIYSSLGLVCSLVWRGMTCTQAALVFPTPEDKGGSKLAESPVWEQRAHLAQASAQRYCSNKDSPKMKPKACGFLSWGCLVLEVFFMVFGIHVHTLHCKSVICHKSPCNQTWFFSPHLNPHSFHLKLNQALLAFLFTGPSGFLRYTATSMSPDKQECQGIEYSSVNWKERDCKWQKLQWISLELSFQFQTFLFSATISSFCYCCVFSGCSLMEMSVGNQEHLDLSLLVYWRMCSCLLTMQLGIACFASPTQNTVVFTETTVVFVWVICLVPVSLLVALG